MAPRMEEWFGQDGRLSAHLPGYQPRRAQAAMAADIAHHMMKGASCICEAGTGVGKTMAYLLPVCQSGEKAIISTGTKTLQHQVVEKDVPLALKVAGGSGKVAILKGRQNYLSRARLADVHRYAQDFTPHDVKMLRAVEAWAMKTTTGDLNECAGLSLKSAVARAVAVRARDSLDGDEFYSQARKRAMQADLLILNHHLLAADMVQAFDGGLLEERRAVVIDEAHHFPTALTQALSAESGSYALELLLDELRKTGLFVTDADFTEGIRAMEAILRAMETYFRGAAPGEYAWHTFAPFSIANDARMLSATLDALLDTAKRLPKETLPTSIFAQLADERAFWQHVVVSAKNTESAMESADERNAEVVVWVEVREDGLFTFHSAPISIAARYQAVIKPLPTAWIYTSATLSVGGDFRAYKARLGMDDSVASMSHASPFDYAKQVAWYECRELPYPGSNDAFMQAYMAKLAPVLRLTEGRAFLLFSSYAAMRKAKGILEATMHTEQDDYTLLMQGEGQSNGELLRTFATARAPVLFATNSFWEGVDIRGQALSLVAIDKLPFMVPDTPYLKAREAWYETHGGNAFRDEQLPHAVLRLKQGFGRLIRDITDKGIFMLGDRRIWEKPYGQLFIKSLPECQRLTALTELERFWTA